MLLHDVADRLNTVSDHLPLPDQIHPDPALCEILDDEVRHLARLLGFLAGESAFRHRASARYPARPTATVRRTTLALAAKHLRAAADTRTPPTATTVPSPSAATTPSRSR